MEPLASLEHIKSEVDLWTVSFTLDAIESILKIEPKADLLQSRPTGGIALKTSHLQCTDRQTDRQTDITTFVATKGKYSIGYMYMYIAILGNRLKHLCKLEHSPFLL